MLTHFYLMLWLIGIAFLFLCLLPMVDDFLIYKMKKCSNKSQNQNLTQDCDMMISQRFPPKKKRGKISGSKGTLPTQDKKKTLHHLKHTLIKCT